MRLRVPAVDDPDFVAEVALAEAAQLKLVGSADTAATTPLAELLATLHGELLAIHCREIVVDMTGLEVMASSCFKELVGWLGKLQELDAQQRYRIRFRSNPAISWQKHSLTALSCFDTDIVTIEG